MRNEERHGLEAHEVEAYNKLMELLGHMWDFISVQAEMQLKMHKEKRKSEKVVHDSQERAFWRIQRPQSSQASCLDENICKLDKKLKKKSLRNYENQLERLKFSLKTKPWLKAPKASET
jgi:regulator of G-protein signaling